MLEADIKAEHTYRCVLWDIYSPKGLSVEDSFDNLTQMPFPTYDLPSDGPLNRHHWVLPYVWDIFMPKLAHELGIPFNPYEFKAVADSSGDSRFNRHLWNTDFECIAYRFKSKSIECRTYSECCSKGGLTKYHSVIRFPHESVLYTIPNPPSNVKGRRLLLNCDSMSIPLILLLLPYYQELLCLDFRYDMGADDYEKISRFEYTDYACIMYGKSYLLNKHRVHNLTYNPNKRPTVVRASKVKPKPTRHNRIVAKLRGFGKHHR